MTTGMLRRDFLFGMGALATGFYATGISSRLSSLKDCDFEDPNAHTSGTGRFFMSGGILEFNRSIKNTHLHLFDIVDFIPTIKILNFHLESSNGMPSPIH